MGRCAPRAGTMYGSGNQLLAGATFPTDKNRAICVSDPANLCLQLFHRRAIADQFIGISISVCNTFLLSQ